MASSGHLKPEEEGEITTTVKTGLGRGKLHKTITVISNDPEKPQVVLSLKAFIRNSILPQNPGPPLLDRPASN